MKGRDKRKLAKRKRAARKGLPWMTKSKDEEEKVNRIADKLLEMLRAQRQSS